MAQRERGVGTEAGKTADVKREAVREGSEEGQRALGGEAGGSWLYREAV
jgi:hypothetical protein